MTDVRTESFVLPTGFDIMPSDESPTLAWIDVETTGLEYEDVVLELGIVLTDIFGRVYPGTSYSAVIAANGIVMQSAIAHMANNVRRMHVESGLLDEVYFSLAKPRQQVDHEAANFLLGISDPQSLYIAGSSIAFDKLHLQHWFPITHDAMHYRALDVSSFKVAFDLLKSGLQRPTNPLKKHRVLADIADSINEWKTYLRVLQAGIEVVNNPIISLGE